ncbi:MAG: recombinase family protein [Candidatus Buchananbacteria bacterium]
MQEKPKNGIIYYRVSTDEQAKVGYSLDQQKKICTEFADRNEIKILKYFHDDGVSAKTADRPGLKEMLDYCRKNHNTISFVITYKLDRLSRNAYDFLAIRTELEALGINYRSVTEDVGETPAGKLMGGLVAVVSQYDNDQRSERVKAGMKEKIEQGEWAWKAPLGYLNTRDKNQKATICIDEVRAPLITMAFEKFSTSAYKVEEIREIINEAGLRTWKDKPISSQLIYRIITDKFYIGIMAVWGQEYIGNHAPLVEKEIFRKCQVNLKREERGENIAISRSNDSFPLRHFAICSHCGRPLTAAFSTGKLGGKYPYYRCYNKECDSPKSISQKIIEEAFIEHLKTITPSKATLESLHSVILKIWNNRYKELNEVREKKIKKIEKLKEEKVRTIEMKQKELLSDKDFKIHYEKINNKIEIEESELIEIKTEDFNLEEVMDYVFKFINKIPYYWENGDFEQKVKLQSLIFPKKTIYNYSTFETPEFSPIFVQKEKLANASSPLVAPRGIEPRF